MEQKLEKLLENEVFVEELKSTKSLDQAVDLFNKNGLSITVKDLSDYMGACSDSEVSEENLSHISGGSIIGFGYRLINALFRSKSQQGGGTGAFGGGGSMGGGIR